MAVQDLTPQLRTRLSQVERAVGWFVILATLLLLAGFGYYVYQTAQRKGWFVTKIQFFTLGDTAAGLMVGDPVQLMGFDVGNITRIDAQPPGDMFNVYVEFEVRDPYFGYLWTEGSRARVIAAGFLGKRTVEVTKGTNGVPTHLRWQVRSVPPADAARFVGVENIVLAREIRAEEGGVLVRALTPFTQEIVGMIAKARWEEVPVLDKSDTSKQITAVWNDQLGMYEKFTHETGPYWLPPVESPALSERLEAVVLQVESALPAIFNLTNQLTMILSNTAQATARANELVAGAQPIITNLTVITGNLREPNGSLGQWLLPPELQSQLGSTLTGASIALTNANQVLATADTNLSQLSISLLKTLDNLAGITGNLNQQVQTNDQILANISAAIRDADELIQGLKKHWLLRSAFKEEKKPGSQESGANRRVPLPPGGFKKGKR